MKLLEALKNFSVNTISHESERSCYNNIDSEKLLCDCRYEYDNFIHNLKELCYDEEAYNNLCNIEITDDVFDKLKANDTYDLLDDNINELLLSAAWLTYEGIDYAERKADDNYDDLYEDEHNYEFCFGDFNFSYEFECDIDLT